MSFIYVITNDINGKQYVGKTNRSIEKRFQEHIKDKNRREFEIRPLYRAMNKYGIKHFSIELLEECSEQHASEREIYWIDKLNTYHDGYNATSGGDGKPFLDYSLIIQKYAVLQNTIKVAEECSCHPDTVRKILKMNSIPILAGSAVNKQQHSKPVIMWSLEKEKLNTFNSLGDAAQYLIDNKVTTGKCLSTIRTHISEVCKNKRKTAYGYKWSFINAGIV